VRQKIPRIVYCSYSGSSIALFSVELLNRPGHRHLSMGGTQ